MRNQLLGIALLAALALAGCASKDTKSEPGKPANKAAAAREADLKAPVAESSAQIPRFRIRDWSAPNDRTVIVVADDGTRYRAETMGPCLGLNFATQLAFVNRGGFEQVDRFSSVLLGDGTRCAFQTFDKLKAPAAEALDKYEKADEKKDEKPE